MILAWSSQVVLCCHLTHIRCQLSSQCPCCCPLYQIWTAPLMPLCLRRGRHLTQASKEPPTSWCTLANSGASSTSMLFTLWCPCFTHLVHQCISRCSSEGVLSSACNNADVPKSEHDVRIKQASYLMVHASQLCSIQHKYGLRHFSQTVLPMLGMLSLALHVASDTGWDSVYRLSAANLLLSQSEWVISTSECFREPSYLWRMPASSGCFSIRTCFIMSSILYCPFYIPRLSITLLLSCYGSYSTDINFGSSDISLDLTCNYSVYTCMCVVTGLGGGKMQREQAGS